MRRPSFMPSAMSLFKCSFTVGEQFPPFRMGGVPAHWDRDSIPNGSPKQVQSICYGSIEFLYTSMARWNLSKSIDPMDSVLSASMRFAVFTASSALQLAWGFDNGCAPVLDVPQLHKGFVFFPEVNCGSPSDVTPLVCQKSSRRCLMRPSCSSRLCFKSTWPIRHNLVYLSLFTLGWVLSF